jgi:hypothetical protein
MDAINFACVMEEISKSLNTNIDAELTAKIYDIYEGSYENYTLLELIHLLRMKKYEITVPWNKKAIIKMIQDNNLDIPKKYEPMEPTKWEHYRVRKSLDVISILNTCIEFDDCGFNIFQDSEGNMHRLEHICRELVEDEEYEDEGKDTYDIEDNEVMVMYFANIENQTESRLEVEDFIWSLDNEDITIVQYESFDKFLNEEEKNKVKNYVRYM